MLVCKTCGEEVETSAYGKDERGYIYCYKCCAERDESALIKDGNSKRVPLYFVIDDPNGNEVCRITNWPGSLEFQCSRFSWSNHNWHGVERLDVWFDGPDGYEWWGTHYGYNSQIVRCQRTKTKTKTKAARS